MAALPATASGAAPDGTNQLRLERTVRYLQDVQSLDGGYSGRAGGDSDVMMTCWVAMALAAAGINPQSQRQPGGVDAWTYIEQHTTTYEQTTDYERTLLAAVAAGESGRDVGGTDLIARILERQHPGDGGFPQKPGGVAYVNATAFAILSLSGTGDPAAEAAIQHAADWLVANQNDNGSWASSNPGSLQDADMTGAAIQALVRAGHHGSAAESRALDFLRSMQHDDGGFSEVYPADESNSASTSWVVQGLWAAGIDPRTWQRAQGNPLDYLASLQQPDGSIVWKPSQPAANPVWMTAYAAPAFSGQPLPAPAPPLDDPPPTESPTEDGLGATSPDPTAGEGGLSAKGSGVIAGGGGAGAPLFSRPQPQSQGNVAGGVRRVRPLTKRERHQHSTRKRRLDPAANAAPPTGTSNGNAVSGVTPTPSSAHRPGAGSSAAASSAQAGGGGSGRLSPSDPTTTTPAAGEVTGRVIGDANADAGTPGRARAEGIAPGLLGAQAGGDPSSGLAIGIACGLVLCAGVGSQLDRRRPRSTSLA
jgi:prenyltransferase beta subunit